MADPTIILKILADVQKAVAGLGKVESATSGVEKAAGSMALPAGAALAAIAGGAALASKAASDLEQSGGAVESVFKDSSDAVKAFGKDSAKSTGLAQSDYQQMAAVVGAQLKGMGTDQDALAGKTNDLIGIASDLAATFGGDTSTAVEAVSALLRGERDPIEKYGVSIKEVDVKAQKAKMGLDGLTGAADKQATATATLALLTQDTADAHGAFAREADTAAHAQQVANAQIENATAALGTALLPVIVVVTGFLGDMAQVVQDNSGAFTILIGVVAAVAAGILAVNLAFKLYKAATLAATAAQWLMNAALTANPIGLVVIAVAALAAGLVLLWQNSETFRTIVTGVFNTVLGVVKSVVGWIVDNFGRLAATLAKPFQFWLSVVQTVVASIRSVIDALAKWIDGVFAGIRSAAKTIGDAVDAVNPFTGAPPPASRTARAVAGPWLAGRAAAGTSSGRGITVNVYTTGDSIEAEQSVVRAIRRVQRINAGLVLPTSGRTA